MEGTPYLHTAQQQQATLLMLHKALAPTILSGMLLSIHSPINFFNTIKQLLELL